MPSKKAKPVTVDPDNPLAQLPDEGVEAYEAFIAYWEQDDDRSVRGVAQQLGKSSTLMARWSAQWRWPERIGAQLAYEARQRAAARVRLRERRRAELEDADWDDGENLRQQVRMLLAEMPKFRTREVKVEQQELDDGTVEITRTITVALNASAGDLARAMVAASGLQHQATDAQRVIEEQIEAVLDRLRDALSEEEYARALAAIATDLRQ